MKTPYLFTAALVAAAIHLPAQAENSLARGRYLVNIGGCNDCHTAGFAQSGGKVPEAEWLKGDGVGFSGPWGVSYPANLRLVVQQMSEAEWRKHARSPRKPPMPWYLLAEMTDQDVNAIYRYIKSLGPAGEPAPVTLAPGQPITTPHIPFVPQPPAVAAK